MAREFNFRRLLVRFAFLVMLAMLGLFAISWTAAAPNFPAGNGSGKFAPCPESPNCVSTQTESIDHQMKPIPWQGTSAEALDLIKRTLADGFPRAKLVAEKPGYLRFEFKSLIFRFVDDVEFLVDEKNRLIHFRSASRVGHSDLGVNRKRMERVVKELQL